MRIKNVHLKSEYLKNLSGIKNIPLNVSLDNTKIKKKSISILRVLTNI